MRKLFILAAALLTGVTVAQAQFKTDMAQEPSCEVNWLPASELKAQVDAPALDAPSMESLAVERPATFNAYVNSGTSVWYQKPKGTYSYTFSNSGNKYAYVVVPMFMPLTYLNKYATPEEATWINNSGTALTADANFNYRTTYPKPTSATSGWYAPLITAETDTFRFGGTYVTANSRALAVSMLDVRTVYTVDKNEYYSTSFSDITFFGTHTHASTGNVAKMVTQYMEAPAAPMWVENIWFNYCSLGDTLGALQNGATVTFTIYSLATPNSMTGATVLYTTEITADNVMSKTVGANSAGTPQSTGYIEIPVGKVIEGPYAIVLDGFNREGVNFGVYMARLNTTADFYARGGVYPTLVQRIKPDGEVAGNFWQYNATNGTQYNAVFALDMMWDVAYMNTNYLNMTAPAAGGDLQMVGSNGTIYKGIAVRTTYVWDEGGYTIDGLPEWLTVTTHSDADYYANNNSSTIVHFNAQPNYTGETRTATLRVVSAKGAKGQEVTVTQAPMPDVYIMGEVGEQTWDATAGQKMDVDAENAVYTATINCDGRNSGYNYFSFTTELAENNDEGGWNYIAPYRFGAVSEATDENPNGDFFVTDEMLGIDLSLTNEYVHAFRVAQGEYNLTLNYADMKLKIEKAASTVKLGDVNGDGDVNVNDVTVLINYILGKNPTPFVEANANVNGDEGINVNDVTALINMILN